MRRFVWLCILNAAMLIAGVSHAFCGADNSLRLVDSMKTSERISMSFRR
jgi:hypothetical protein